MLKFTQNLQINFNIYTPLIVKHLQNTSQKTLPFCSKFNPYNVLTKTLLSSTEVGFGKNLIRTWVEFGKKMVYGKQGVRRAKNWRFFGLKC